MRGSCVNLAGSVSGKVKKGVFLHPWDTMKKKKTSACQRKQGKHINFSMKLSSTYFPESLPEGCVEGTLGALCNDNIKTDNQNVEGKSQSLFFSF